MNELGGISKHLTALTTLEKSLHLKQMQISGLLAITKGIGMNHPAADLFSEYKSFDVFSYGGSIKKKVSVESYFFIIFI